MMDHRHEPGVPECVQHHRRYGGYGAEHTRGIAYVRWSPQWEPIGFSPEPQYSGQRACIIAWDDPAL